MPLRDLHSNRRRESRYRTLTGQPMSWTPPMSLGRQRKGWVLDVSKSGMALMLERETLPRLGDVIDVSIDPAAEPVAYEIVRIQHGQQKIAVVGCQRVYGKTAELDLPAPAWSTAQAA